MQFSATSVVWSRNCIPHSHIQSNSEMRSILELTSKHDELIVHAASKAAQGQQSVHALQHICRMCLAVVGSVIVAVLHSPQELGKLAWLQLCASQVSWSGVNPFCGQVSIHSEVRCQSILLACRGFHTTTAESSSCHLTPADFIGLH